ncbi:MAG TPA: ABC transporter substrate-binding protein [Stellaceae bacterium]|nr:ABC transporter substrate-binding protein [Stellaceae bacterium]
MSNIPITLACGFYDRMHALLTGDVRPAGIDLNFIPMDDPRQIFDRMGGGLEFDASEMSISEHVTKLIAGNSPIVAIPVMISRVFRHQFIFINAKSGIKSPKDLEGRKVGVPLYVQTAAVFIRGLLQHEYGVDLSTIHWIQGAMEHPGTHGKPAVLPVLKKIDLVQNNSGKSLNQLLEDGDIDAMTTATIPEPFGRNPNIQRLFPDFRRVEAEYFRRTKIFPIMHVLAIKRSVYEKHPFVATSLYNACCEARALAIAKARDVGALRYMLPWMVADFHEIDDVFGNGFWPYGVEENRPTLEALVTYLHEQAMIPRKIPIEELFVPTYGYPNVGDHKSGREGWTTQRRAER